MAPLTVSAVLSDAWDVYRLLFRRSILVAAVVYALINAAALIEENLAGGSVRTGLSIILIVLTFAGPIVVQGALVKIVESVHEARRPESSTTLFRAAGERIGSLIGASLIYSLGVVVGLVLLVVPGLLAAARWSLMAPMIMLEGRWAMPARERSSRLVSGKIGGLGNRTWFALGVVVVSWLLTNSLPTMLAYAPSVGLWDWGVWLVAVVVTTLGAPYQAHVLSVLYYRLVDPERPAIHPQVRTWPSVWHGAVVEAV